MSNHLKGLLITFAGIIVLSPDSLLVRLIDTDQWTLLFWRGIATCVGIGLLSAGFHRGNTLIAFRRIGRPGLLMAAVFSASTIFFVTALNHTSVANTLVLAGTAPIFAALLSKFFLSEQVLLRTWITILVVVAAVALIVSESYGGGAIWGDISALACAVMMGGTFVITRHSKGHDMTPAMALSGLLLAALMIPWASPMDISFETAKLLAILGAVISIAFALLTIGPRFLPAPEVSMLMPLETVFGTAIVWFVVDEVPSLHAIIGGGIVIFALAIHSALTLRS